MEPLLKQFVATFNSGEYFDAHEVLEELWLETEGESKNFYKGLIQCAVALVHYQRGNMKGATKVCRTACGYLNSYLPDFESIDTAGLLKQMEHFFAADEKQYPVIRVL
jgi:predicted metal-dependent hydrolase